MPDWIFTMKKMDRKDKKHMEKFPLKRETISTKIEKNIDREYGWEMKVRDKIFAKKMKKVHRENQEEKEQEGEGEEEQLEEEGDL